MGRNLLLDPTFDPGKNLWSVSLLLRWLAPWSRKKGSICPPNFARRRRRIIYGAYAPGALPNDESTWSNRLRWSHDITRHSYGSFFEAQHRSEPACRERLAANMGHRDYRTFQTHYRNSQTTKEAAAFWEIDLPDADSETILRIG